MPRNQIGLFSVLEKLIIVVITTICMLYTREAYALGEETIELVTKMEESRYYGFIAPIVALMFGLFAGIAWFKNKQDLSILRIISGIGSLAICIFAVYPSSFTKIFFAILEGITNIIA